MQDVFQREVIQSQALLSQIGTVQTGFERMSSMLYTKVDLNSDSVKSLVGCIKAERTICNPAHTIQWCEKGMKSHTNLFFGKTLKSLKVSSIF